ALHPRRDIHLEANGRRHAACAPAVGTGIGDPRPLPAAGRAGGRDLEEAPGLNDLAPAAAVVARRRHGALARTGPLTLIAKILPVDLDRARGTPRRLDQVDLQLQQQVRTRPGAAPAVAEEVPEQAAAEDVPEGRHDILGRPEVVDRGAVEPGLPVTIATRALFRLPHHPLPLSPSLASLPRPT